MHFPRILSFALSLWASSGRWGIQDANLNEIHIKWLQEPWFVTLYTSLVLTFDGM